MSGAWFTFAALLAFGFLFVFGYVEETAGALLEKPVETGQQKFSAAGVPGGVGGGGGKRMSAAGPAPQRTGAEAAGAPPARR